MLRIRPQKELGGTENDPFGDGRYTRSDQGHWAIGPRNHEGGPTSYYLGEVTGIAQVVKLMHNQAAGRRLIEGLGHIPKSERIFDFDDPEPWILRIRRIGRSLFR